ncbi:betaC1 protein [Codiaeum leaf curl betasatellite]|uniref:BetaC1 protein n=1 Tax=Codiaeum leaf curl betasatellite TaxID=2172094 RepID=A0A499QF67_9VIRU|nr:betaC1 protein [Codiaeum leaf curl betasatellite]AWC14994.1 betaC1 protein [Codiaeum leaf curl betasatellite]AWC14996.1 betaC1 protein [Codiaeum leaf curl betasatellite]
MTIKYNNQKGMKFIIDVRLKTDNSILVQIQLFSTGSPSLTTKKFMIPYGHSGIIPPFNFNNLEEGIQNMLALMYKESTIGEFKQEDMVEGIDMLMMEEAPVIDINVMDAYDVFTHSSV